MLCLVAYSGLGYDSAFIRNANEIVQKIHRGYKLRLVAGQDDLCMACVATDRKDKTVEPKSRCLNYAVCAGDHRAILEINNTRTSSLVLRVGHIFNLGAQETATLRADFASGKIRGACVGCCWGNLCTEIATRSFKTALLFPDLLNVFEKEYAVKRGEVNHKMLHPKNKTALAA